MPRPPRLPRRRPQWQRVARNVGTVAARIGEFVAWFGIGYSALALADAANAGGFFGAVLWLAIFGTVISGGSYGMRYGTAIFRAVRRGRASEGHRRNPSSNSQAHNLSKRGLSRRFRRG